MIIKKITIEINGKINHAIFECARKNIALFPAKHVGRTDAQLAQRMGKGDGFIF